MKGAMSSEVATLTCFTCHAKLSCWVPDRDVLKISDRDDLIWKTYKFRALGSQSRVGRFGAKICGFHLAVEGINGQGVFLGMFMTVGGEGDGLLGGGNIKLRVGRGEMPQKSVALTLIRKQN